jgi:hypothetical protein
MEDVERNRINTLVPSGTTLDYLTYENFPDGTRGRSPNYDTSTFYFAGLTSDALVSSATIGAIVNVASVRGDRSKALLD